MSQIPNPNTVFLRPQPSATPTDYIREQVKAGLVMMASRNLAIYTGKSSANQGPQGEVGPPGPSTAALDTVIASCSSEYGDLLVSAGLPHTTFRASFPIELVYLRISLTTAPVGSDVIVDVHMNGLTLFSTMLRIDAGMDTSVGSAIPSVLAVTSVPDNAKFQVYVLQVGASVPGTGLKVEVIGNKVVV